MSKPALVRFGMTHISPAAEAALIIRVYPALIDPCSLRTPGFHSLLNLFGSSMSSAEEAVKHEVAGDGFSS